MKINKWGEGIPVYGQNDLMNQHDIHIFAMEAVKKFEIEKNDYELVNESNEQNCFPNYVCRKNDSNIFILVKEAILPDMPIMSMQEKKKILAFSQKYDAECYYAPVGIGSTDPERFHAELALKGDSYYINYEGLIRIESKAALPNVAKTLADLNEWKKEQETLRDSNVRWSLSSTEPIEVDTFESWKKQFFGPTFQESLMRLIDEKGLTNQEFYKAAYLDRKLFSAMKNNLYYKPSKETAVACCFGLCLTLDESEELLNLAGYKLSLWETWDRIIYFCLKNSITDIDAVNEILYDEGEKCLRV